MNFKQTKLKIFYFLLIFTSLINPLYAASPPEVAVAPPSNWVEKIEHDADDIKNTTAARGGEYYLLVDEQYNVLTSNDNYKHYVIKLLNEEGVEDNSRISMTFSPEFQSLTMHEVIIWRDGKALRQSIKDKIKLLQREKDLENFIYDGRWTATVLLEDIRKGDILEYSYSIRGQNPAYQGVVSEYVYLQWMVPVSKQTYRMVWPKELPITITASQDVKNIIKKEDHAGFREYRIELSHQPVKFVDSQTPDWYKPWDRVVFSGSESWGHVIDWGKQFYKVDKNITAGLNSIVSQIRKDYKTKLEQASAALHYVQDEIRYVGIEVGAGSFVPSSPLETVRRRYGDCKDKTYLLLSLFKALDIEAYAAFANTDYGESIDKDGPRLDAFNHVLVKAILNDVPYWLETTTNNQASTLDKIMQPDYGLALVLKRDNTSLSKMQQARSNKKIIYDEVFDLTAGVNKQASYVVRSTLVGADAERFRRRLNSKGKKKIVKEYIDYYANYYSDIKLVKEVEISDNKKLNQVSVVETYAIPNFWKNYKEEKRHYAFFYNNAISSYIKKPKVRNRISPYEYTYPVNLQQNITVLLPSKWSIDEEVVDLNNPFFNFHQTIKYNKEERKLQLQFRFETLTKYIDTKDIAAYIKATNDIKDHLEYNIYLGYANNGVIDDVGWLDDFYLFLIIIAIISLLLVYTIIEYRLNQKCSPDASRNHYYPVSSLKFYLLSVFTGGLYSMYWFYKNWVYVKSREHSKIIPWGRALFQSLWFYPFYKTFSRDDAFAHEVYSRNRNIRYAFLAIMFFALMILGNNDHVVSYIGLFLAPACILPFVEKINHVVPVTDKYFEFNSRWRPRHFIFITLFTLFIGMDISTSVNLIPNSEVIDGDKLWDHDRKFMQRIGILSPDEKLILFYSDAVFSFKTEGNGLSSTGVFAYWKDEETGALNKEVAKFSDIANIQYIPDKENTSSIKVTRHDDSHFVMYVKGDREREFQYFVKHYWKKDKAK